MKLFLDCNYGYNGTPMQSEYVVLRKRSSVANANAGVLQIVVVAPMLDLAERESWCFSGRFNSIGMAP